MPRASGQWVANLLCCGGLSPKASRSDAESSGLKYLARVSPTTDVAEGWLAGDWPGDILATGPRGRLPGQASRTERWCAVSTSLARLGSTPEDYERIGIKPDQVLP